MAGYWPCKAEKVEVTVRCRFLMPSDVRFISIPSAYRDGCPSILLIAWVTSKRSVEGVKDLTYGLPNKQPALLRAGNLLVAQISPEPPVRGLAIV
jgi:hypothetical protein